MKLWSRVWCLVFLTHGVYALPCHLFSMFMLSCASAVHSQYAFDTLCSLTRCVSLFSFVFFLKKSLVFEAAIYANKDVYKIALTCCFCTSTGIQKSVVADLAAACTTQCRAVAVGGRFRTQVTRRPATIYWIVMTRLGTPFYLITMPRACRLAGPRRRGGQARQTTRSR